MAPLRWLKVILAAAGALATLAGGAWAGGAFGPSRAQAQAGRTPRATDALGYGRADGEIPVGDALSVNGQPMQLSLFTTEDPPARVVEYYRDAFSKRGLLPIAYADAAVGHVSVFDPEDGMQRFISALPQPDGQTLVLLGVTNPRKAPRMLRGAKGMPFPVPDEHRGFLGYEAQDEGTRSQNGQFATSLSAAAVLDWYRQALAKDGYVENRRETGGSIAVFDRPGASITVAAQALGEKASSMVFVNRIEGGQR